MKFLFCNDCGKPYPIYDPEVASLIGKLPRDLVEFTEGQDEQRKFCRREHDCEDLTVIAIHSIPIGKGDIMAPIAYIALNKNRVPVIVVKTRKNISEPPRYQFYRNVDKTPLNFPPTLLMA